MKRLFSFLTIISMVVLSSLPAYALPVITEDTKNAIEDASLETRKEVVSTVLQKAEDSIDTLEQQLTSAEYVSEETQNDGQALIDDAQTELDSLQSAVADAENSADFTEARQDAINWLKSNQDAFKELAVDMYLDGLRAANQASEESIILAKTLIPYFKAYKLNTSTYEQLISNANAALDISTTDVTTAINDRTQDSLEKATKSTTATAEAVALMVKEADTLYAQIVQ